MTLHTLFPLALVCHCCSTSIPLFRSHSTLLRSFSPRHRLRCCAAQASTKAAPAPQDDRRKRIRARTATADDIRAEIARIENAIVANDGELQSKSEEIKAKNKELQAKLQQPNPEANEIGVKISELNTELSAVAAELRAKTSDFPDLLRAEYSRLTREVERLEQQLANLPLNHSIATLGEELQELKDSIGSLKKRNEELHANIAGLKRQMGAWHYE